MTARDCYPTDRECPRCRVCGAALVHEVTLAGQTYALPDDRRKRYCSPRCKQAAYRDRLDAKDAWQGLPAGSSRRWLTNRQSQRRRSARTFGRQHDDAYCLCGRKLTGRADQRYCSPGCRQAAYRQRRREASGGTR